MTKVCSKCKIEKDVSDFHNNKAQSDGLSNQCKQCCSERNLQRTKEGYWPKHYQKYKENCNIRSKAYYEKNKVQCRQNQSEWYQNNREATLKQQRDRYYSDTEYRLRKTLDGLHRKSGISLDVLQDFYHTQLEKQNGCCAICGISMTELNIRFHIDHNHTTGKLRGLLCSTCNTGIGGLKDSPDLCSKAAKYLE